MSYFAAVPVPIHIGAQLEPLQRSVEQAKWHPTAKMHITLAYFGEIKDPALLDRLSNALATLPSPALDIQLTKPAWQGGLEPKALIVDVHKTPELEALATGCVIVAQRVGAPVKMRSYEPHVTLAYIDQKLTGAGKGEILSWQAENYPTTPLPSWRADMFGLYQSGTRQTDGSYLLHRPYKLG